MAGKHAQKRRFVLPVILVLAVVLLVYIGVDVYLSNNVLRLETIEAGFDRLPSKFDGLTVIHLSDVHEKSYGEENHELLGFVERAKPDLIAITGDLIDSEEDLPFARQLCTELVKIAPVYYVTGNHEWYGKVARPLKAMLRGLGVTVLDNRYSTLTRGNQLICVAGIDDPNGPADMKSLPELVSDIRADLGDPFIVLLSHRYERFDSYAAQGIDLALTGHAHGGLIRLPFTDGLIAPNRTFFPQHTDGLYTDGTSSMIVSRGSGDAEGGFRLFNRPQVLRIILTSGG